MNPHKIKLADECLKILQLLNNTKYILKEFVKANALKRAVLTVSP